VSARLPEGTPEALTPAEVAELYRVDSKTVGRWARANVLESFRTPGGHRRYPSAQFAELLAAKAKNERRP
jgi:excisionase family DNA binding protein